jgi:hypothetical protein
MSQAVALVSCIRKMPSSNLGRNTDYPEVFLWLSSAPPTQRQIRDNSLNQVTATSFLILSN